MKRKEIEQLQKTWKENERAIEKLEGQITEEDLRQGRLKNEIVVYDSILKCLDKEWLSILKCLDKEWLSMLNYLNRELLSILKCLDKELLSIFKYSSK